MAKILIRFKGATKAVPVEEADAMVFIENGEAVIVNLRECAAVSPPENAMKQRPPRKVRS